MHDPIEVSDALIFATHVNEYQKYQNKYDSLAYGATVRDDHLKECHAAFGRILELLEEEKIGEAKREAFFFYNGLYETNFIRKLPYINNNG